MEQIAQGKLETALDNLQRAETILLNLPRQLNQDQDQFDFINFQNTLLSLTYNNLGCLYQKKNQNKTALKYLRQSLTYESLCEMSASSQEIPHNDHGTLLNLCAILSKLNKHEQALKYVEDAISKYEKLLIFQKNEEEKERLHNSLAISYYNKAVELEFLMRYEDSLQAYQKSFQLAQSMTVNIDLMHKIQVGIENVKQKLKPNHQRTLQRTIMQRNEMEKKPEFSSSPFGLTKVVGQSVQQQVKETYRVAREIYKTKRGKGPKQGSHSKEVSKDKHSSNFQSQAHQSASEETSPQIQKRDLGANQEQILSYQELASSIDNMDLRIAVFAGQQKQKMASVRAGSQINQQKPVVKENTQRLSFTRGNQNFQLPSLGRHEEKAGRYQNSISKKRSENNPFLISPQGTTSNIELESNEAISQIMKNIRPPSVKNAWTSERTKPYQTDYQSHLKIFQQKSSEESQKLKSHYEKSADDKAQIKPQKFIFKRTQPERFRYAQALENSAMIYSGKKPVSSLGKSSQLKRIQPIDTNFELERHSQVSSYNLQSTKAEVVPLSQPQSPKQPDNFEIKTKTPSNILTESKEFNLTKVLSKSTYYSKLQRHHQKFKPTLEQRRQQLNYQVCFVNQNEQILDQNLLDSIQKFYVSKNEVPIFRKDKEHEKRIQKVTQKLKAKNRAKSFSNSNEVKIISSSEFQVSQDEYTPDKKDEERFQRIENTINKLNFQLDKFHEQLKDNLQDPCIETLRELAETEQMSLRQTTNRSIIKYEDLSEVQSVIEEKSK